MAGRRITVTGLALLGIGLGLTALLGPLAGGAIDYRISENMENQTLGGDAVLLLVAMPAALMAAWLWLRDHQLAPLLALATASFAAYTYLGFVLIPDYARYDGNNEQFYPLFATVLALSIALAAVAWSQLGRHALTDPGRRLRRTTAVALVLVAAFFTFAWGSQISSVMGGDFSTEYLEHPTAFWLIRTLDFAILIPAALVTAVGLVRGSQTALRGAYALSGFFTLMLVSIASMAVVLIVRDDPAADPAALAIFVPITVGLTFLTWKLWNVLAAPSTGVPAMPERRIDASSGRQAHQAAETPS